jgi:hypothetical protein
MNPRKDMDFATFCRMIGKHFTGKVIITASRMLELYSEGHTPERAAALLKEEACQASSN